MLQVFPSTTAFNRKLCFQAFDSLNECIESQENKNKFRCPDQLYAYEQWCPRDFQTFHAIERYDYDVKRNVFDADYLKSMFREKQSIENPAHYNQSP